MTASRCIALFVIAFAWISAPAAAAPEVPVPGVEGYTVAGDRVPPLVFDGDMRTLPLASPAMAARTRVYFPLRPPDGGRFRWCRQCAGILARRAYFGCGTMRR